MKWSRGKLYFTETASTFWYGGTFTKRDFGYDWTGAYDLKTGAFAVVKCAPYDMSR